MSKLEKIYSIFQPLLSPIGQLVIAGGAARDTLMGKTPKDYDLFILVEKKEGVFDYVKQQLGEILSRNNLEKTKIVMEWHKSEPYLIESIQYDGADIQIMVSFAKDIYDLVDGFDWNVCLFAYGMLTMGETAFYSKEKIENIGVGKYLKLNKLTYPYSSLRRGYRFSERFCMRIDGETIRVICVAIMEAEKKKLDAKAEKEQSSELIQIV